MRKIIRMSVALCALFSSVTAFAQFYTVNFINPGIDTLSKSKDPYVVHQADSFDTASETLTDAKVALFQPTGKCRQGKSGKSEGKSLTSKGYKDTKKEEFSLFETTDSIFLELIRKRLNVCMPLDYLHLTSGYGYRKDPFERCMKFHDGIDLRGKHELAYCMLPGKVVKVRHGNTGYGNHVVIDHGRLRTLYGHLSQIAVNEGDIIEAGTVIGLTGMTGKASGFHLHLSLHRLSDTGEWVSVNPQPFIESLNGYISELGQKLNLLQGKESYYNDTYYNNVAEGNNDLTIGNLYEALLRHGVKFPKIVLAQAILESGWGLDSRLARQQNNLFGLRKTRTTYHSFDSWEESVKAYKSMVQYKYKGGDYLRFLKSIGYAENRSYINKVKRIADSL